MKTKELKQLLKQEADKIPIRDYQQSILKQVAIANTNETLPSTPVTKKRKAFYIFPAIVATISCILIAIFLIHPNSPSTPTNHSLTKAKKILSYELTALANVIDVPAEMTIQQKKNPSESQTNLANEIHQYLLFGEMMFNDQQLKIQNNPNQDVEYKDYAYKMTVEYQTMTDYTLYYNETKLVEDQQEIDEVSSTLNGILIKDGYPFTVVGKKEVEKDEYETMLIIYQDQNQKDYVKISQETEVNENEYTYEFYQDGQLTQQIQLELEMKNKKKEMTIEITKDQQEKEFEFEYLLSKNKIICSYEDETTETELDNIVIQIYHDYYLYLFENGEVEVKIMR